VLSRSAAAATYAARVPQHRSALHFFGHATVLLQLDGLRIMTDPLLADRLGPLHRHGGGIGSVEASVDVVLVSHAHRDHLHQGSLRRLGGRPRIVVPLGVGGLVRGLGRDVVELAPGERLRFEGVEVEAIEARHHVRHGLFGSPLTALGYRIAGSSRVYFAGDTDLFDGMAELAGTVDVALLPVWGWGPRLGRGHLDPARAAEAVARIRPRLAVPIHWGTFYPFALARVWPKPLGDPPIEFAKEVARLASATEVRILKPGEHLELDAP
jgi:L-ascorbate metabolism protein UlaG (beta-lactamase superfamily)